MCCCLNKLSNEYNIFNYLSYFIEIFKKKIYFIVLMWFIIFCREVILIFIFVGLCVIFCYVFYLIDVLI